MHDPMTAYSEGVPTHRCFCLSLAAAAVLLSGCDTGESFDDPSVLTPRAGLSNALILDIKDAAGSFEAAMKGAYALPKPKGCSVIESYEGMLMDYLVAAAQRDTKQTSASLHSIHGHLRCATAREFAMFYRALHTSLLAKAHDKDQPIVREVDELAIPLTLLLQDMGARDISPELGMWLYLRGDAIKELSAKKDSVLDALDVVVPHGLTTRRVSESEKLRVYDAIRGSAILGPCATSELITPDGIAPLCPQDCANIPPKELDPELGKQLVAACEQAHDLLAPLESQPTKDAMFDCVEQYKAATSQDGFAACLTTHFRGLREDDLTLGGSNQVNISKQCQLSQDGKPPLTEAERTALIQAKKAHLADLYDSLHTLDDEITDINLDPNSNNLDFARVDMQLEPNAKRLAERIVETEEEIEALENGNDGTQRCSQDSDSCSDSCDIQSQVQQLTQDCLQATEEPDQPSNPDPIDPLGPEVDPESPLGELMACMSKAAAGDNPSDSQGCNNQLTCENGVEAIIVNGVCICEAVATTLIDSDQCSWQIGCLEGTSCDCDGVSLTGDPIPRPDAPGLLFEFRR